MNVLVEKLSEEMMTKKFFILLILLIILNPRIYAGVGYPMSLDSKHIVLQKQTGLSFANQVTKSNTTYEIRDVFDLYGNIITLPENCTLIFAGGALKNGTLVGNNTYLIGNANFILDSSLNFRDANQFHVEGITFPKGKDISMSAQRMLDIFNVLNLETGIYYLTTPIVLKNHNARIKGAGKGTILTTDRKMDYAIRTAFDEEVSNPGKYYNVSFVEISDIKIEGSTSKYFKNGIFLDGPSCTVSNCFVNNIQSVGVQLGEWCNILFNCIITRCDIGALVMSNANSVNVCYNRIESNNVNLVLNGYRGANVNNNTLEGGSLFNLVISNGYNCNIRDNYFEGHSNSITDILTTTELRSLAFPNVKELRSFIWLGTIEINQENGITKIIYEIGKINAPTTVNIEGNYVDIYGDKGLRDPNPYFVLIGSCLAHCNIQNNTFSYPQNAVCAFLDIDNAVLGNTDILNNFFGGSTRIVNPLDLIHDNNNEAEKKNNRLIGKYHFD